MHVDHVMDITLQTLAAQLENGTSLFSKIAPVYTTKRAEAEQYQAWRESQIAALIPTIFKEGFILNERGSYKVCACEPTSLYH